jgi:NhaP-type Na+/H+ or K+/H+ antiporter
VANHDLIQGVTFGIVLFTLIVQGSTAGRVVERSGAGQLVDSDAEPTPDWPFA